MEAFLNYRISRVVFGIAIGLPLTAISIVTGLYGMLMGYGGIIGAGLNFLFIGVMSITTFIGITGVWRRLITSTENTSTTALKKPE